MTAMFLLIPGLLFGLAAAGMLWIRVAAAEYRRNWSVPQDVPAARPRNGEATVTDRVTRSAVRPR